MKTKPKHYNQIASYLQRRAGTIPRHRAAPATGDLAPSKVPAIPRVSDSGKWFCLSIRPGWMARVENELYSLGFRTFTPKQRKWVSHARRKTAVYRPILARYLFVDVDHPRQSFGSIRDVRGVERILSNLGIPLAFTSDDVAIFIERQLVGEWDEVSKDKLPVGAKIVFMDGPHEDDEAVITSIKGNKVSYKIVDSAKYGTTYAFSVRAA